MVGGFKTTCVAAGAAAGGSTWAVAGVSWPVLLARVRGMTQIKRVREKTENDPNSREGAAENRLSNIATRSTQSSRRSTTGPNLAMIIKRKN